MPEEHSIEIRVRYQETDAMGIVHHANYLTYFELGRIEFLRAMGRDYRNVEGSGLRLVVTEAACRYFGAARFDDLLRLTTIVERVRGTRIEHRYLLRRDGELLVEGRTTIACVDESGRPRRLPAWLRSADDEPIDDAVGSVETAD
jgi:acyl-CoA thioester hydrolase